MKRNVKACVIACLLIMVLIPFGVSAGETNTANLTISAKLIESIELNISVDSSDYVWNDIAITNETALILDPALPAVPTFVATLNVLSNSNEWNVVAYEYGESADGYMTSVGSGDLSLSLQIATVNSLSVVDKIGESTTTYISLSGESQSILDSTLGVLPFPEQSGVILPVTVKQEVTYDDTSDDDYTIVIVFEASLV